MRVRSRGMSFSRASRRMNVSSGDVSTEVRRRRRGTGWFVDFEVGLWQDVTEVRGW